MVKKIRNPETGRMVNVTGKIGQKVLSQRGGSKDKRRKSANRKSKKSQKKPLHGGKPTNFVGRLQNMSSHLSSKLGADLCVNVEQDMKWYPPNYLDGKPISHIRRVGTCIDILDAERLKNATETILIARQKIEKKIDKKQLKNLLREQNDNTIKLSDSEWETIRNYVKDNTILNQAQDYLQRINPDRGRPFPENAFGNKKKEIHSSINNWIGNRLLKK